MCVLLKIGKWITLDFLYAECEVIEMSIGLQISKLRNELGWSITHFAQRLGTNTSSVKNWENGSAIPSTDNIIKLCYLLHTTPNALLEFEKKPVVMLDGLSESNQRIIKGTVQVFFDEQNSHGGSLV